ncbi:unnamed protein product [Parajaminaea phylloscopi]
MAPNSTVIICRHSQATHNVADDYSLPDAPLTDLGKQQASKLPEFVAQLQQQVDLVVSSPLKRTLQTTLRGWGPAVERLGGRKNVVCLPQLQECNAYPCDTGSAREVLEQDPEVSGFDFGLLTPDWTSKQGQFAADEATLNARAQWVRQFVRSRPEKTILLVAHGDIIRRITGGPLGNSTHPWKNAEVRIYQFDPQHVSSDACWLTSGGEVAAAGGWEPTSSEMHGGSAAQQSSARGPAAAQTSVNASSAANGSSLLPGIDSGAGDFGGDLLAQLEGKIAEKQESVQSKARELDELEARLAAAEARKQELESRGVRLS